LKLVIEFDGDVHNLPDKIKYYEARQKYLETFGISFVRIKNEELMRNSNKIFSKIENAIKE